MKARLQRFLASDEGAVTVDWVVLTAGVVTVIVLIFGAVSEDTLGLAGNIGSYIGSQ
ncbi:Flp family type IVb pilin [Pseudooceanicola onchidii]|uniref:Flp family type IVb pilin n=1 Tax=Pseudooceanicola onchidii TaxID=2562279 RepID=UPI00145A942D|nr:hypothetical protein [Pseudooceanicola onchidii]